MFRFPCPYCGKTMKASEEQVGTVTYCGKCQEEVRVPSVPREKRQPAGADVISEDALGYRAVVQGMSPRVRGVLAVLAGAALVSLLAHGVSLLLSDDSAVRAFLRAWALPAFFLCLAAILVVLYGHGTSCPSCHRWWAKDRKDRTILDEEEFDRDGVVFKRVAYQVKYQCKSCEHCWYSSFTEEYKKPQSKKRSRWAEQSDRPRYKHHGTA